MSKFGPGVFTIGEVGSEIDASCLINSLSIDPSKEAGDSKTMLCGTVKQGARTYTYVVSGNVDIDDETSEGFFATCNANPGMEVPFVFTPEDGVSATATGYCVLDPLSFGGEEYGEDLASDFEFDMVGKPGYEYPDTEPTPEVLARRRVVDGLPRTGVRPSGDGTYAAPAPAPAKTTTTTAKEKASA